MHYFGQSVRDLKTSSSNPHFPETKINKLTIAGTGSLPILPKEGAVTPLPDILPENRESGRNFRIQSCFVRLLDKVEVCEAKLVSDKTFSPGGGGFGLLGLFVFSIE
ncbi:hypothetical protein JTE90_016617 [Oedothorax gibbosus]|uniref:Uncharacterized protein n=1 Tax=Oedothorax gibbosus TaxID=931172 RepID=A0AAV6UX83_9ARAC|nr:hypothetical protein JTE90_016617 [Oedothorax gibbosus]